MSERTIMRGERLTCLRDFRCERTGNVELFANCEYQVTNIYPMAKGSGVIVWVAPLRTDDKLALTFLFPVFAGPTRTSSIAQGFDYHFSGGHGQSLEAEQ